MPRQPKKPTKPKKPAKAKPEPAAEPDPSLGRRRKDLAPQWKKRFLEALAECGIAADAARAAGIHPKHALLVKRKDAKFRRAWLRAKEEAAENIIWPELQHRAVVGERRYVLHDGQPVWVWVGPDDKMLPPGTHQKVKGARQVVLEEYRKSDQLLLNAARTYHPDFRAAREQKVKVSGGTTNVNVSADLLEWDRFLEQLSLPAKLEILALLRGEPKLVTATQLPNGLKELPPETTHGEDNQGRPPPAV